MSWSTSELWVRLAPWNRFKPSSKIFYWPFEDGTSFVDLLCLMFVMPLCAYVFACLVVTAEKGLTSWLSFVVPNCLVCHFPFGILVQVWYLIVSIPDLCTLTYLYLRCISIWCVSHWRVWKLLPKVELPTVKVYWENFEGQSRSNWLYHLL